MDNEIFQLLLSGKIGDGSFINQRKTTDKTYRFSTNSINKDYVEHKKSVFNRCGLKTVDEFNKYSGFNPDKHLYAFRTLITEETTYVGRMSVEDVLLKLDKLGLIYYYLDDGSLHKRKHFMHLYCNSFEENQAVMLVDLIEKYYPQKRCTLRVEHKKDGRMFYVVYIPVTVAKMFSRDVRKFLIKNNIRSMLYKTIEEEEDDD